MLYRTIAILHIVIMFLFMSCRTIDNSSKLTESSEAGTCYSNMSPSIKNVWASPKIICKSEYAIWDDSIFVDEKRLQEEAMQSLKASALKMFSEKTLKLYPPRIIETLMPNKKQSDSLVKNIVPAENVFKHLSTYKGMLNGKEIRFFVVQTMDPKSITITRTLDGKVNMMLPKTQVSPNSPIEQQTKHMCGPANIFKKCGQVIVDHFPEPYTLFELAEGETFSGVLEVNYEFKNIEYSFLYEKAPEPTELPSNLGEAPKTYIAQGNAKAKEQISLKTFWADFPK